MTGEDVRQALYITRQTAAEGAERRQIVLIAAAVRPNPGPWVPLVKAGWIAAVFLAIRAIQK